MNNYTKNNNNHNDFSIPLLTCRCPLSNLTVSLRTTDTPNRTHTFFSLVYFKPKIIQRLYNTYTHKFIYVDTGKKKKKVLQGCRLLVSHTKAHWWESRLDELLLPPRRYPTLKQSASHTASINVFTTSVTMPSPITRVRRRVWIAALTSWWREWKWRGPFRWRIKTLNLILMLQR